jgi:hypothetical protein
MNLDAKEEEVLNLVAKSRVTWSALCDARDKRREIGDRYDEILRKIGDKLLADKDVSPQVKILRKTKDAIDALEPEVKKLASAHRAVLRDHKKTYHEYNAEMQLRKARKAVSA